MISYGRYRRPARAYSIPPPAGRLAVIPLTGFNRDGSVIQSPDSQSRAILVRQSMTKKIAASFCSAERGPIKWNGGLPSPQIHGVDI